MMKTPADILIVDDIETNRDTLSDLVTLLGHNPILAEGGLVAFEKLKNQPIDLVLLDIMMPEIDGYDVLSHIKDDVSLQHLPVIMITAFDDTDSVIHCIKMGADDYLTKPFNRILLKARIGACLERKYLRDQEEKSCHQIEEYSLRLEELVLEQTKELTVANERLRLIDKAKGDALKLIYYDFQNSLRSLFQTAVKDRLDDANELLQTVKHSLELTKIEPSTVMFVFELNAVHAILQAAIELATDFAQSRQVSISSMYECGGQALTQQALETVVTPEFEEELDQDLSSILTWQVVADDEQSIQQKELCANALAEVIKTAIKFSRHGGTVSLSCEPLQKDVSIGIHATGRTIPEEELSQFFEVPSNIEKMNPGRHPGRGPSTAKHIITLLGGEMTVANRGSAGISFVVKLKREGLGR